LHHLNGNRIYFLAFGKYPVRAKAQVSSGGSNEKFAVGAHLIIHQFPIPFGKYPVRAKAQVSSIEIE
jgi:hypothetical protein